MHCARMKENKDKNIFEVCDGNHRFDVVLSLGLKEIPIYDHGVLSLNQRKEVCMRYNEWGFTWNATDRAQVILDVVETVPDFEESMPYDHEEYELMAASLQFDGNEEEDIIHDPKPRKEKKPYRTIECPHCHESFNVNEK